jgi:hypothetical protein
VNDKVQLVPLKIIVNQCDDLWVTKFSCGDATAN